MLLRLTGPSHHTREGRILGGEGGLLQGRNTMQARGLASRPAGSSRRAHTDTRTLYNQEHYIQGQQGNGELN